MKLTYRKRITRAMLRAEPDTLFVFGDNMARTGYGGQAMEMRGEPNAVGIPTKWSPGMSPVDFFTDRDFDQARVAIDDAFHLLRRHSGSIVWPEDGIGTGLAELPQRAPKIWAHIEAGRVALLRALQSKGEGK